MNTNFLICPPSIILFDNTYFSTQIAWNEKKIPFENGPSKTTDHIACV